MILRGYPLSKDTVKPVTGSGQNRESDAFPVAIRPIAGVVDQHTPQDDHEDQPELLSGRLRLLPKPRHHKRHGRSHGKD